MQIIGIKIVMDSYCGIDTRIKTIFSLICLVINSTDLINYISVFRGRLKRWKLKQTNKAAKSL